MAALAAGCSASEPPAAPAAVQAADATAFEVWIADQSDTRKGYGGQLDSHGVAPAGGGRYLWVMDRHSDVAEILDLQSGQRVHTVDLNGPLTQNAAPDLIDTAPSGDRLFVALRGPVPLSGDPHNAVGSTPGMGIIQLTEDGRNGSLVAIVPMVNERLQPGQAPDPHGLRVRLMR